MAVGVLRLSNLLTTVSLKPWVLTYTTQLLEPPCRIGQALEPPCRTGQRLSSQLTSTGNLTGRQYAKV